MNLKAIFSRKKIIIPAIVVIIILIAAAGAMLFTSDKLTLSVKTSADLTPSRVDYFFESANFKQFYKTVKNSHTGKEILNSTEWDKFFQTPSMVKFKNIFYLLQVKSGALMNFDDLPELFDGSVSISRAGKSMLLTAKTNVKSKIGITLLTAFKGEKVKLKDEPIKPDNKESKNKYKNLYDEEKVDFKNITISKFSLNKDYIYLTMLGDFLFVSDSIDLLKESLELSASVKSDSLKDMDGMDDLYDNVNENSSVVYLNTSSSIVAPLIGSLMNTKGVALLMDIKPGKNLDGHIYAIEYSPEEKDVKNFQWEKYLTGENILTFFSKREGLKEYMKFASLGDGWNHVKSGASGFLTGAGLNRESYFKDNSGFMVSLNSLSFKRNSFVPFFTIGYNPAKKAENLARGLFKVNKAIGINYQGVNYSLFKTAFSNVYKPSLYSIDDMKILASHSDSIKEIIAAKNGNKPVIADLKSYKALGDYGKAPYHMILNINQLISGIEQFYLYGASRSRKYTSKTIKKDIMPLLNTFKKFNYIHLAMGLNKVKTGKMVID